MSEPAPSSPVKEAGRPPQQDLSGWRRRALVLAAVLGCLVIFALARLLAQAPHLPLQLSALPSGGLQLTALQPSALARPESDAALLAAVGQALVAVSSPGLAATPVDGGLLHRSPRWQVQDHLRARQVQMQSAVKHHLQQGQVTLHFGNGHTATVPVAERGYGHLGWLYWPLAGSALLLYLLGFVLPLSRPDPRNLLFMLMCVPQAGNLLLMAAHSPPGLGWATAMYPWEAPLRLGFDLMTAAAALHSLMLHPLRLRYALALAAGGWAVAVALTLLAAMGQLPGQWWWTQGACAGLVAGAWVGAASSYRQEANPLAMVVRRLMSAGLATWLLVTLTVATASRIPAAAANTSVIASGLWLYFSASVLLLIPFLSRGQVLLREFALLAGISTVATSLDLLFVALFALGPFASLTLAVFLALGVYTGVRQWLLNHMLTTQVMTTERAFEQIYRMAREVRSKPGHFPAQASLLLRDLFEPIEMLPLARALPRARAVGNGSALLVPIAALQLGASGGASSPLQMETGGDATTGASSGVILRFARRGRRLFTQEDARLADRVLDQLRQAVAYDAAVELGRSEERQRIAQDLHDDIGARLLTLMYQAQTPEMEDYIRQTLKDLKTLSRGLATGDHMLSYAAAEWRADLEQRLSVAQVKLNWTCEFDRDLRLSMVQWSALTRVIRELVSNALAHSQARHLDVHLNLSGTQLHLSVADDGVGKAPEHWAHGLGLGGVRKRVKQLGGAVQWRENRSQGIVCEVHVRDFAPRE
jgi:signal transduction histidine kinase